MLIINIDSNDNDITFYMRTCCTKPIAFMV